MRVEQVAEEDDAALAELLAFAGLHGRPRATTPAEYRELMVPVDAWACFVARDDDGAIEAATLGSVHGAVGADQVQVNGFLAPGAQAAFDAALDAIARWGRAQGAVSMTAHVSEPSDDELAAWRAAGFAQVGERARVIRDLTPADADLDAPTIEGARIVALADHPELEPSAEALWRQSHEDVPSALRFDSADLPPMRRDLGLEDGDPIPSGVLVAVDAENHVVGLVVGVRRYADRPHVMGHRMTAADRAWRGRGVAHALKVELLRRAAREGINRLEASNDSGNVPMRAINDRLGYRVEYRLVLLRRAIARQSGD